MRITKETSKKILLMIFGLTLFPEIVHWIKELFTDSPESISDYYRYFFSSLLDMGVDGMIVWGIACGPYMVYEIVLLVRALLPRSGSLKHPKLKGGRRANG